MGKTRLALEVAERVRTSFANGACFVALAPFSTAAHLPTAIAGAVKLTGDRGGDPWESLCDYFRHKELLLVLDNFEHLLDGGPRLDDLLAAAPKLKLLITSRERLDLTAETVFNLSGLALPPANRPDEALCSGAVRLFIDGARRARPGFVLETKDLPATIRICQLVQGMPLGILLAAMWTELLSLQEIADEISHGLDFLETNWRDLPERQRSLRAVFNSTWSRLTSAEQDAFMKLSIFQGRFTRHAAEMVAGCSLRTLAALINKALLWTDADGRCTVHELLRQFAAEQLDASDFADAIRNVHSAYYLDALRQCKSDLEGHSQIVTFKEINIDLENIRKAWARAIAQRQYESLAAAVPVLYLFYLMRGRYGETDRFFAETAASLRQAPAETARDNLLGDVLARQANFPYELGQRDKHERLLAESHALTDLSGAPVARAFRLTSVSWIAPIDNEREIPAVEPAMAEAVAIYLASGDRWAYAATLRCWGIVLREGVGRQAADPDRSQQYLQKAYTVFTELGESFGLSMALMSLGHTARTVFGDLEEAVRLHHEAVALQSRFGSSAYLRQFMEIEASVLRRIGELLEAEHLKREALAMAREVGEAPAIVNPAPVAEILARQSRFAEAHALFEEGLAEARANPSEGWNPHGWIPNHLLWLARLDWWQGNDDSAEARLKDLLAQGTALGGRGWSSEKFVVLIQCIEIALARGTLAQATTCYAQAVQFAQTMFRPWGDDPLPSCAGPVGLSAWRLR